MHWAHKGWPQETQAERMGFLPWREQTPVAVSAPLTERWGLAVTSPYCSPSRRNDNRVVDVHQQIR
jgi:hypothetical protein